MAFEQIRGNRRLLHSRTNEALGRVLGTPGETLRLQNRRRGDPPATTTASSQLSLGSASGAMTMPLPYCPPFANAIRKLSREQLPLANANAIRLRAIRPDHRQRAGHVSEPTAARSCIEGPRDPRIEPHTANVEEEAAAQTTDVDSGRSARSSAIANAASSSRGNPRQRANPSPEPLGTMPRLARVPLSALATSLTVPSPPHATTRSHPRATHAAASRRPSPAWVVSSTVPSRPREASSRWANAARAAPSLRRCPTLG